MHPDSTSRPGPRRRTHKTVGHRGEMPTNLDVRPNRRMASNRGRHASDNDLRVKTRAARSNASGSGLRHIVCRCCRYWEGSPGAPARHAHPRRVRLAEYNRSSTCPDAHSGYGRELSIGKTLVPAFNAIRPDSVSTK